MTRCITCELLERRDRHEAPLWDSILRTPHWDVVHSFDTSLPAWLVLVARRHVEAVAGLTDAEAIECGRLQRQVSSALAAAVGCPRTYVVQFAESVEHPHVHYHVIPRMADMPNDARGPSVFRRYLGVSEPERVPHLGSDSAMALHDITLPLRGRGSASDADRGNSVLGEGGAGHAEDALADARIGA
jgi:diadenosine tetraphosphate (Ap4A) HIT family hydrolase